MEKCFSLFQSKMWYFHIGVADALYFMLWISVLRFHGAHCLQVTVCLTLFSQVDHVPEWDFVAAVLIWHALEVKYLK